MAQIPNYRAGTALNPTPTPQVEVSTAGARALQNFGASVSDFAAVMQDRQEKKDTFKAENAYRRLNIELESDLNNQAQNVPEGGAGFMDGFVANTFQPKRDKFLDSLPESLKPRFTEILNDETGADFEQWRTRAATVERDEGYRWAKSEINITQGQMATAISMNPEGYDDYLKSGQSLIDTSPLPTPEKALLTQQWEETAQVAYLNTLLEKDPQGVLRELGVDTRQLSPTTQFDMLSKAVQWQESSNNPNAVSAKGAIGLMQVMPGTAADIAKTLGDTNFPAGAPENVIRAYMSNPVINKMYGEAYLKQQLRTFGNTRNPIETALVAYNAGPGTAQKWVESGYDDAMLPKETRDYKAKILDSMSSPLAKGDPSKVTFVGSGTGTGSDAHVEKVNPDLKNRVADAFATIGLDKVRITSGSRSVEENKAVGGAEGSQHVHDNAMDIDVSGMSHAQRVELIKSLSAAGITGLGIGANIIHADLGGRRAWGYATSAGGGEVPKWATAVIADHLQGVTPRPRAVDSRFASLPYDKRQAYLNSADQAITSQNVAAAKVSGAQKVEVRNAIANEIASIRTSGKSTGQLDEGAIATVLGEDDYLTFASKRDIARRTFTAVDGMSQMAPEDLISRVEDYAPTPGAGDFAAQQEIETAVQREADRVITLRAKHPDKAAMEFPAVKSAFEALQSAETPAAPNEVQSFVRLMLETQAEIDVAPDARAPVPQEWALEIGRALSRVPEPAGKNMEDVRYQVQAQYEGLKEYFGEYADEVMIYSLSEYKGVSTTTAELITAYMQSIGKGGDPFRTRQRADQAEDMDQVGGFDFFEAVSPLRLFGGSQSAIPEGDNGLSPEEMLRQQPTEE